VWQPNTPIEKIAGLTKLPNLSHLKYIAHVKLSSKAGVIKPHKKDKQHLRFWMCTTFDPVKAIDRIEPLT
jgi:hypothetical protein